MNAVERAAEVLSRIAGTTGPTLLDRERAQALADAGLLVTEERDRGMAAEALRGAADAIDDLPSKRGRAVYGHERELADGQDIGLEEAVDILRERADRIERGDQ